MDIPDIANMFGIKTFVEGGVVLVKERYLPIMRAKGEARAKLIELRGQYEYEKEKNRFALLERAEKKLQERNTTPSPVKPDILLPLLDSASVVTDETLRDMWAELLCGISLGSVAEKKAGIYQTVLLQITSQDATILETIVETKFADYFREGSPVFFISVYPDKNMAEFKATAIVERKEMVHLSSGLTLDENIGRSDIQFALSNLGRLGLLGASERSPQFDHMDIYNLHVTAFGRDFMSAVGVFRK